MLRKGIDDIRLLRSPDPRIASQMLDLAPYRPVSSQPGIQRDLSIAVPNDVTPEEIGDRVRDIVRERADSLEAVEVLAQTAYAELPTAARERLGIAPSQKNVLLRLVIRDLTRTLTSAEANALRDDVYAALHEGTVKAWAGDS
jgi:phenylalanyl-tRNA synthetase alpha chain